MSRQKDHEPRQTSEPDATQRRLLPYDLAASLRHLPDEDVMRLAEAVAAEMKNRQLSAPAPPDPPLRPVAVDPVLSQLTRAQINLIRSSIQAGVKPAALSRQFGLTRAQIAAALRSTD
jgi:hypothetical protein